MPRLMLATFDETALRQALTERRAALSTIYLESETRIVLASLGDFLGPRIVLPPVRWLHGRAFGPTLEIRWTLDGQTFETAALTETGDPFPAQWQPSDWTPLLDAQTRERTILLAGVNSTALPPDHALHNAKPSGGLWVSAQIARPLLYPTANASAERLALRCLDYTAQGLVVLTRLCEIVPAPR